MCRSVCPRFERRSTGTFQSLVRKAARSVPAPRRVGPSQPRAGVVQAPPPATPAEARAWARAPQRASTRAAQAPKGAARRGRPRSPHRSTHRGGGGQRASGPLAAPPAARRRGVTGTTTWGCSLPYRGLQPPAPRAAASLQLPPRVAGPGCRPAARRRCIRPRAQRLPARHRTSWSGGPAPRRRRRHRHRHRLCRAAAAEAGGGEAGRGEAGRGGAGRGAGRRGSRGAACRWVWRRAKGRAAA